ncbi:quinoprotein dehydrogenase-associated SoxYZ-like carrier [Ideonella alba]|uniref:Quinoprotein dehydrogenase-associated SoxYZ-like carrier n=1 Tax=Ideonella alba TaxID=2824118 RepID=A0A940YDN1_9BURK|nr:quinoprotein dehydrogenase-associated SoxYZ-like carrier [Ideonella alba]MBQ0930702.1 quinoprotein dehydrogenase-associated SoxYZ-like carrier [Ideonella alba]
MSSRPPPLHPRRRSMLGWSGLVALPWAAWAAPPAEDSNPDDSPIWRKLRAQYFDDRTPALASPEELSLSAPKRAGDPAFVPLATRRTVPSAGAAAIRRLSLIIDQNPSPLAAIFELPEGGALPDLETRVRVDEYSFVRAVAERADGRRLMALRYVKASGGCSAPPGGDEAAQRASLGRMLFRAEGPRPPAGQPWTLQWQVLHPNHSGLAMDQYTRQFTPAEYIRSLRLWQGDRLLLNADLDFALSENPSLRLRFVPQGDAPLRAEVTDTRARRFTAEAALSTLTGGA